MNTTSSNSSTTAGGGHYQIYWVAASAGFGKTTILTGQVLALLLSGVQESKTLWITIDLFIENQVIAQTIGGNEKLNNYKILVKDRCH